MIAIGNTAVERMLIEKWAPQLAKKLRGSTRKIAKGGLDVYAFNIDTVTDVELTFEDGSSARLNNAIVVRNEDHIAVFTEHCGYHEFYANGTAVRVVGGARQK